MPKFIIFGYLNGTLNIYLSVPSHLMDASNHLICFFLSCPVYAAAHAIPFCLLPTSYVVYIIERNQQYVNNE